MDFEYLKLNMDTKLFPIIGCPMGQSSAAFVYNPLFKIYNTNEIMFPIEIPKGGLPDFLQAFRTLGMKRFTLTMPHKSDIIPLLDEVDEDSRIFNSVNIVKLENGRTVGTGMDGKGCMAAIKNAGVDIKGMEVIILGAGSIIGVICLEMARAGVKKATIINRTPGNAKKIAAIINSHTQMPVEYAEWTNENLDRLAAGCDLFMQSTPLGMYGFEGQHSYTGFIDKMRPDCVFMENIVNPPETHIVKSAKARGLKIIYGMDMMLGQLGEIFNFCYGISPTKEDLEVCRKSECMHFGIPFER